MGADSPAPSARVTNWTPSASPLADAPGRHLLRRPCWARLAALAAGMAAVEDGLSLLSRLTFAPGDWMARGSASTPCCEQPSDCAWGGMRNPALASSTANQRRQRSKEAHIASTVA